MLGLRPSSPEGVATSGGFCPLCDHRDETVNHVWLKCDFVRMVWHMTLNALGGSDWVPRNDDNLIELGTFVVMAKTNLLCCGRSKSTRTEFLHMIGDR